MSELFAVRALLFAGECLAASALLVMLAWIACGFVKSASLRHLVWLGAFAAMLALPLAALAVGPGFVLERSAPAKLPAFVESDAERPAAAIAVAKADPAPSFALPKLDAPDIVLALAALWLAGFGWAMLHLAGGALGARALWRRSRPHALSSDALAALPAPKRECELRLSEGDSGPMTFGVLRPVVLLPATARFWPQERLKSVLLHELAHVRRRDCLTQAFALIVSALYWPNPLVWLAARALRREAEIAADDAVLVSGIKPSAYAGELLGLAGEFRVRRGALLGVSMAQSGLETRVKSVLAPHQHRTGVTSMDVFKIAGLGLAAALCMSFARADVSDPQIEPAAQSSEAPADTADAPDAVDVNAAADDEAASSDEAAPVVEPGHRVKVVHIRHRGHVPNQAEIDKALAEADAALARAEPEMRKAMAAAKVDERVAKALARIQPRIEAEVARAMARARPAINQALVEARINQTVAREMAKVQPQIDAAIRDAHRQVRIFRHRDQNGDFQVEQYDSEDGADADQDEDAPDQDEDAAPEE